MLHKCQGAVFDGTFCETTNYSGYQTVRMDSVILASLCNKGYSVVTECMTEADEKSKRNRSYLDIFVGKYVCI